MRQLRRSDIEEPSGWDEAVTNGLKDRDSFERKARTFERLALASDIRQEGFKRYAPEELSGQSDPRFKSIWTGHKPVKTALHNWTEGKCAYCEKQIERDRLTQVEHFKPKSLFPSKAYDFRNYFPACGGCNGLKSNKWPSSGSYVRPDRRGVEKLFEFQDDGSVHNPTGRVDVASTIKDFGLDRRTLRRERRIQIEELKADIQDTIDEGVTPNVVKRLLERKIERVREAKVRYGQASLQALLRMRENL